MNRSLVKNTLIITLTLIGDPVDNTRFIIREQH